MQELTRRGEHVMLAFPLFLFSPLIPSALVQVSYHPIMSSQGSLMASIVVATDITPVKKAQEECERLRALVKNLQGSQSSNGSGVENAESDSKVADQHRQRSMVRQPLSTRSNL